MIEANFTLWPHLLCSTRVLPDRKTPALPSDEHIPEKCETKAAIPRSARKLRFETSSWVATTSCKCKTKENGSAFLWGICDYCAWTSTSNRKWGWWCRIETVFWIWIVTWAKKAILTHYFWYLQPFTLKLGEVMWAECNLVFPCSNKKKHPWKKTYCGWQHALYVHFNTINGTIIDVQIRYALGAYHSPIPSQMLAFDLCVGNSTNCIFSPKDASSVIKKKNKKHLKYGPRPKGHYSSLTLLCSQAYVVISFIKSMLIFYAILPEVLKVTSF